MVLNKTYHFVSGLPRAGSTLLTAILNQRPDTFAWGKSPLPDALHVVYSNWGNAWQESGAMPLEMQESMRLGMYRGIVDGSYAHRDEPIVVDDSRGWLVHLELLETILGRKPKVLVPYRPLVEILASFERIYRQHKASSQPIYEKSDYFAQGTVASRCAYLCSDNQVVGLAVNRIRDAERRGWGEHMYFVDYNTLAAAPAKTMASIERFLEIEPYDYDFNNVVPAIDSDDRFYGFERRALHQIRPAVKPHNSNWRDVLGEDGEQYANFQI